jgi:hypothetical protein
VGQPELQRTVTQHGMAVTAFPSMADKKFWHPNGRDGPRADLHCRRTHIINHLSFKTSHRAEFLLSFKPSPAMLPPMKNIFVTSVLIYIASGVVVCADTPSDIVARCKQEWGTNYVMQRYCQKEQIKALQDLNENESPTVSSEKLKNALGGKNAISAKAYKDMIAERYVNGMAGVNTKIKSCYARFSREKKIDVLQYCYSSHSFANGADLFNNERSGTPLNPANTEAAVEKKLMASLLSIGIKQNSAKQIREQWLKWNITALMD